MISTQLPNQTSADADDRLIFADESQLTAAESIDNSTEPTAAWKVMLVDDEPSVHQATKIALKFFTFEDKPLAFISAYSGEEAKALLAEHTDIAIVFLDVIMETQEAGLDVAKYIREELQNDTIRIVLRTGQPGQVPEESVVVDYDINDYKTKLELTQKKLFTTLVAGLRAHRDPVAFAESQAKLAALNHQLTAFNQTLEKRVNERTRSLAHEIEEREKAEEALKLYIHALTHDLRNPVTGMTSVLQSLLHREMVGEPPTAQIPASVLKRMSAGCDRQLKMINSLLETRSIELWGVALQPQRFSLSGMLHELMETWQPRLQRKRVQVSLQIDQDLPEIEGDRTQLWRVFDNLIDNALKYNPPGIHLTVAATLKLAQPRSAEIERQNSDGSDRAQGDCLQCSVTDNGIGIKSEQAQQLFELYRRGKEHSAIQGFGLGLYICQRIIEAHGSTLKVASPPLQSPAKLSQPDTEAASSGTQFYFDLWTQLPATSHPNS